MAPIHKTIGERSSGIDSLASCVNPPVNVSLFSFVIGKELQRKKKRKL